MKKLISLLTIVIIALVASQSINAKYEKKRLFQKTVDGVEVVVGEYYNNDKFSQFYVGAINNTNINYYVIIEMEVQKNGELKKTVKFSEAVNPGMQKVFWDTKTKVLNFKVTDIKTIKL